MMENKRMNQMENEMNYNALADGELTAEALDNVDGGWIGGVIFLAGCAVAGYAYGRWAKGELGLCK